MGAGKSSVGRMLGELLGCEFEDLDDRIEHDARRSIAEIFQLSGEAEFRRLEHEALRHVIENDQGSGKVVGLGGGAFVQAKNASLLDQAGARTIFLDAPVRELWRRCTEQRTRAEVDRPLQQSYEQFQELFVARRSNYLKASLRIETVDRPIREIAEEIVSKIGVSRISPKKGQNL